MVCGAVLTASIVVLCISTFALAWSDVSLRVMGVTIPWVFYVAYGTGRVIFASPVQIGDFGSCIALVYPNAGQD